MKRSVLYEALGRIDPTFVEEAARETAVKKRGRLTGRQVLLIAACLCLVVACVATLPLLRRETPHTMEDINTDGFHIVDGTLLSYDGQATRLTIPDGVETIADFAFLSNTAAGNITSINLGHTVKQVSCNAFAGCAALSEITFADTNENFTSRNGFLMSQDGTYLLRHLSRTETEVTIPAGVQCIAAHAFQGEAMETVTFPDGLLSIGYNSFAGCFRLTAIDLPDSVIDVAEGAFASCSAAIDGHIPPHLTMRTDAFCDVPFFNSLLAGETCPWEAWLRRQVTLSEAFARSNRERIMQQLEDLLSYYGGHMIGDSFATGAILEAPAVPEGTHVPQTVPAFETLTLTDASLTEENPVTVTVPCEGENDLCVGFYWYGASSALTWQDSLWRMSGIWFLPKDTGTGEDDRFGDWYVRTDGLTSLIFTRADGGKTVVEDHFPSAEPYRWQLSPRGDCFVVEYCAGGTWSFFVEDLSGATYTTWWSFALPCVPYFERASGVYVPHSVSWNESGDRVLGENEHGRFSFDWTHGEIYDDTRYDYVLLYLDDPRPTREENAAVIRQYAEGNRSFGEIMAERGVREEMTNLLNGILDAYRAYGSGWDAQAMMLDPDRAVCCDYPEGILLPKTLKIEEFESRLAVYEDEEMSSAALLLPLEDNYHMAFLLRAAEGKDGWQLYVTDVDVWYGMQGDYAHLLTAPEARPLMIPRLHETFAEVVSLAVQENGLAAPSDASYTASGKTDVYVPLSDGTRAHFGITRSYGTERYTYLGQ